MSNVVNLEIIVRSGREYRIPGVDLDKHDFTKPWQNPSLQIINEEFGCLSLPWDNIIEIRQNRPIDVDVDIDTF